ncbi:MAG: 5'-nucleotidase, lipoprotein e(P4) family [Calditrichaceae bacterium]
MQRFVKNLISISIFSILLLFSCSPKNIHPTDVSLNGVLWMQHAAEYRALTYQAYNTAAEMLNISLADSNWTAALGQRESYRTLPPAIILDIDETILDNTPYESELIRTGTSYNSESWDRWCKEARAEAIPGAAEFCNLANKKGVKVFYVTNRRDHLKEVTRENLKKAGFPLDKNIETLFTRSDESNKESRRMAIAREYRILLLIGDNAGDFASEFTGGATTTRAEFAEQYRGYFGTRWIVLPNPVYGDWEGALFDYNYKLGQKNILEKKYQQLKK